jgi:hypothetical protein
MKILILWNDGTDTVVDTLTEHLQNRLGAFRCAYKTPKNTGLSFVYQVYENGVIRYL